MLPWSLGEESPQTPYQLGLSFEYQVAANSRRRWRNSGKKVKVALPNTLFDQLGFPDWRNDLNSSTAVYGSVRTVVWEEPAGTIPASFTRYVSRRPTPRVDLPALHKACDLLSVALPAGCVGKVSGCVRAA